MNVFVATLAVVALLQSSNVVAFDADRQLTMIVAVGGAPPPESLYLESDDATNSIELGLSGDRRLYSAIVPIGRLFPPSEPKRLAVPFQLVVTWPGYSENLYFGFGPTSPQRMGISFRGPAENPSFDHGELGAIDSMGNDNASLINKYLMARRFHKHWRHVNGRPNHEIALRSARIWFDAATALVVRNPKTFRFDPELREIIAGYRRVAATDASVKARFERYFPAALIAAAFDQVDSVVFGAVDDVKTLVQSGKLDEARLLNAAAMLELEQRNDQQRAVVRRLQGVTVTMLRANEQFIEARSRYAEGAIH